jgi:hypothetical protein
MEVERDHEKSVMEWLRTWNSVDRDGFMAIVAPDFVGKGVMAPQGIDRETIWNFMVAFRETFPDIRWELGEWLVSDGDMCVCHLFESGTFTGPWPGGEHVIEPTNKSYRSEAVMFFRFDAGGLILENKSWYDSVDWFRQIGVDPNVASGPVAQSL